MANFGIIGYIKSISHVGNHVLITLSEYVHGRYDDDGNIMGEKMDYWSVFFPSSARRHIAKFKAGDIVSVKGTIHQSLNEDYKYAINGECIKHFYTRNMAMEAKREKCTLDDTPNLGEYLENDF